LRRGSALRRGCARSCAARPQPVAVLNVGGVANVTYIDGDALIACDTGPGNALVDDFLRLRIDRLLDTDGRLAQAGVADQAAVVRRLVDRRARGAGHRLSRSAQLARRADQPADHDGRRVRSRVEFWQGRKGSRHCEERTRCGNPQPFLQD
jgi:1,6-anhydro-N-acetylmuramate kinase